VILHGVNMVEKMPPYYPSGRGFSEADAAWLEQNGFFVVRLGVMANALSPFPGRVDYRYLAALTSEARMLERHHIYVLLDLHQDGYSVAAGGSDGFPSWMTVTRGAPAVNAPFPLYYLQDPAINEAFVSLYQDRLSAGGHLHEAYARLFNALGRAFRSDDHVLGYDLLNEPWPGPTWQSCIASCPGLERAYLDSLFSSGVHALRAGGDPHLAFVEPFVTFNFGTERPYVYVADPRLGLSFHSYPLFPSFVSGVISNAIDWSHRTNGALLLTEFGATKDAQAVRDSVAAFDQADLPWIFWSFDGSVVKDLEKPPTSANLTPAAGALIEPYPVAVAGTPVSFSYDPDTRTFSFTYSTAPVAGALRTRLTSVFVPPALRQAGISISLSGATLDAPCPDADGLLGLLSLPAASQVRITISPGSSCRS
jgi:endoglycosylceramidase